MTLKLYYCNTCLTFCVISCAQEIRGQCLISARTLLLLLFPLLFLLLLSDIVYIVLFYYFLTNEISLL